MKPGYKTTEFYSQLIMYLVGIAVLFGWTGEADMLIESGNQIIDAVFSVIDEVTAIGGMAYVAKGYIEGRSTVKKGS
ncbi:MAG: hypothetical protein AAF902_02060 [Chloroflexota bacterium]